MTFDFQRILGLLSDYQVDFAVVGGLAGVMQGAPIHTQDVDVLYSIRPPNPERLLAAVLSIGAVFAGDPRRIQPTLLHMESKGHKLLDTECGRLDCLATLEEDTTLDDIRADLDLMQLAGTAVYVISLPRLIQVKKKLNRPKDQLALVQLEATLDERMKLEAEEIP